MTNSSGAGVSRRVFLRAAAVVTALFVGTAPIAEATPTTAAVEVAQVTEADLEAWSLMFATTPEEEQLI